MCIGNRDGGDDGVGPYIADKLKDDFTVLDCGVVPENYTSVVKKHSPDNLLIIDAVEMGLSPGEIRIVPKEKIGVMHISTHGIPISVLINYLSQYVKNIVFIGVQPKTMSGKMSQQVINGANNLIEILRTKKFDRIEMLKNNEIRE
jgi:hydrogenase 3 maturation protease